MATKRKAAVKPAARKPAAKRVAGRKPQPGTSAAKEPAARKPARGALARAPGEALRLAGVGTDAVARATGKAWDRWLAVLDQAGAAAMPHKAIASMLAEKFGVPGWWSQMITVGYGQARGLGKPHRKADGLSASASRTVAAGVDRLHGAWADPGLRALWLGSAPVEVERATGGKSMRIRWSAGGSSVRVSFHPAGTGRSRVQVEHARLPDERARGAQKAFWGEALDRLKAMLEKAA